jgi:hypothetical protein
LPNFLYKIILQNRESPNFIEMMEERNGRMRRRGFKRGKPMNRMVHLPNSNF